MLSIFFKVKQVTLPLKIIVTTFLVSIGTTVEIYSFVFFFSEMGGGGGGGGGGVGIYLVHHPLHSFSPEVGGGCLHGNGRLQGTLQYLSKERTLLT